MFAHWKENYDESRQCIIKQRHHFADTGSCTQNYGFGPWRVGPKRRLCQRTDAFKLWH